jgi:RNA recognition motif-containing protein
MQGSKLYVGNLHYSITIENLRELFSTYGEVQSVNIIEGKGFGFVELSNQSEAEKAKKALDGSDFKGRPLKVNEAKTTKGGFKGKGRFR